MNSPTAPFLVRIFKPDGTAIAGAGFLVTNRHVMTCAHVVAAALPNFPSTSPSQPDRTVKFDFPFPSPSQPLRAKVIYWLPVLREKGQPGGDEDLALLEIIEDELPAHCRAAELSPVDVPRKTRFESFGFPVGKDGVQLDKGIDAYGITRTDIAGGCVSIENARENNKGYFIEPGFSGAPLLANEKVIGMVVRADVSHDTAYMIPARLLMRALFVALTKLNSELAFELVQQLERIAEQDWMNVYVAQRIALMPEHPTNVWMAVLAAFQLANLQHGFKLVERLGREFQQPVLLEWAKKGQAELQPKKTLRLDVEGYEDQQRRQALKELKTANAYLLGEVFGGRAKELRDLTDWLLHEEHAMCCIYNLGGTGKSALVWHWLERPATQDLLIEHRINKYWCSFYARNFTALDFLRDLATELGLGFQVHESTEAFTQLKLQRFILERLRQERWLLVLDGLEREMGAFANPEHFQIDSEEQDRRNEQGEVWFEEKKIRSHLFAAFLHELWKTETKTLITSRILPEDLPRGVLPYPLSPMSYEDALEVWNLSGDEDGSAFQRDFFESIGSHPQIISVVAAAAQERSCLIREWFSEFTAAEQAVCLDGQLTLTERRHRWLELALRDVQLKRRTAWLTLCYIVRRSEASSLDELYKRLVDNASVEATLPGRFRSEAKLKDELDYLQKRRLLGVSYQLDFVDVHPVIRGQITSHFQQQFMQGSQADEELIRHLTAGEDGQEMMLRFFGLTDLQEKYRALDALNQVGQAASAESRVLNLLGMFYPKTESGERAWLAALPALRLRKEQAVVLLRTGNELMTRGLWDESAVVFKRAEMAYQLCGDEEAIEDCRRSHNWQSLYGGALLAAEKEQLSLLEKPPSQRTEFTPYWLALLLAIRQSDEAAALLQSLPADTNRWTLQTVAEAWFYLEYYEQAAALAQQALAQGERVSKEQVLWERLTLGLAQLRLGQADEAAENLDFAKRNGTGWYYNLVPMFALAGRIEYLYREARQAPRRDDQHDHLNAAELAYKDYLKADPQDCFQIPAAEAHLAMAHVMLFRQERDTAVELAHRALKIAGTTTTRFGYAAAGRRAAKFLTEALNEAPPPVAEPSYETEEHEERVRTWLAARKERE